MNHPHEHRRQGNTLALHVCARLDEVLHFASHEKPVNVCLHATLTGTSFSLLSNYLGPQHIGRVSCFEAKEWVLCIALYIPIVGTIEDKGFGAFGFRVERFNRLFGLGRHMYDGVCIWQKFSMAKFLLWIGIQKSPLCFFQKFRKNCYRETVGVKSSVTSSEDN